MRSFRTILMATLMAAYAAFVAQPSPAQAQGFASYIESTFDVGDEGWALWDTFAGGPFSAWHSSSGGYLYALDGSEGNMYFEAPAKFLGNHANSYNHYLEFDLTDAFVDPELRWNDIFLVGQNLTLALDLPNPSTADMTHYKLLLNESAGWQTWHLNMPPPTKQQMLDVLSSLEHIRIQADWHSGPDISRLDNVRLAHSPEPSSYALMGCAALSGLGILFRRRRAR